MKLRSALALLIAGALGGCQTPTIGDYQVSRDSLFLLRQLEPATVSVGAFQGPATLGSSTGADLLSGCSLSAEERPGLPLEPTAYLRGALVEELTIAGFYSEASDATRLTGTVSELLLSRGGPFKGVWTIGLHLTSSTGAELRVREEFAFDVGAFVGSAVCRRAVERFEPAVRALLQKAIRSPEFPLLLGRNQQPSAGGG